MQSARNYSCTLSDCKTGNQIGVWIPDTMAEEGLRRAAGLLVACIMFLCLSAAAEGGRGFTVFLQECEREDVNKHPRDI